MLKKLIVLLIIIFGIWLFFFNGFQTLGVKSPIKTIFYTDSLKKAAESYNFSMGSNFISYRDYNYGFELKYPIGYSATLAPEPNVYLRFLAADPSGLAEDIDVNVLLTKDAKSIFETNTKDVPKSKVIIKQEKQINGNKAYLVYYNDNIEGLPIISHYTTISCKNYTLEIIGIIPEDLADDSSLVNYMIHSVKC